MKEKKLLYEQLTLQQNFLLEIRLGGMHKNMKTARELWTPRNGNYDQQTEYETRGTKLGEEVVEGRGRGNLWWRGGRGSGGEVG